MNSLYANKAEQLSSRAILPAILFGVALFSFTFHPLLAHAEGIDLPAVHLNLDGLKGPQQVSGALQVVFLLTILSLAPALLILMTSFTRFAVVFSFLRSALGTQQAPPNQVVIGLSLFLTFFVVKPVWQKIDRQALVPYEQHAISTDQFIDRGITPLKDFMLRQISEKDLAVFVSLSQNTRPQNAQSLSIWTVIPAFVISELKKAFQIGFMLYVPFIIVDMVVASILLSMGMMMLPPVMISLPFKLMLFIMVDGWPLLIGSLVKSFH
ncbi:MAG: flagellar type III secretion system pore protein FliP [Syntrophobacteraceae bacterium]